MADSGLLVRGGGVVIHRPKASVTKPQGSRGGGTGFPPPRLGQKKRNEAHIGGILGVCKVFLRILGGRTPV